MFKFLLVVQGSPKDAHCVTVSLGILSVISTQLHVYMDEHLQAELDKIIQDLRSIGFVSFIYEDDIVRLCKNEL